jgi:hypothetical protein
MAMKITCPHCKRGMLVPENLAGKKGRCKACQQILTVPALTASNVAADGVALAPAVPAKPQPAKPPAAKPSKPAVPPPSKAQTVPPPPPADVEAEAAALFSDEPKSAETVEIKTIDMTCPFCDEAIHFPLDLGGKRAPCPECKNIIKVPEPVTKDPKDWRKVEVHGPAGARKPEQPVPEGAWGSTNVKTVGQQTLVEAGILPEKEPPRTAWQKARWPILGVSLAVFLSVGGWWGYRWWGQRAADRNLQEALDYAAAPESKPAAQAALAIGAGEYYLHSTIDKRGTKANSQFGAALTKLRSVRGEERDVLLSELALHFIELGGDKVDADKELCLPWDKTQQLLTATLREIQNAEARLQALRLAMQRLLERGQTKFVLPLTRQLYGGDPQKAAEKVTALSVVGLEFLKANDRPSAEIAANEALEFYKEAKGKTPPPLSAEVVALAHLLEMKKPPTAGEAEDDKGNEHVGKVEALARQGEWDKARKQAAVSEDEKVRFRCLLAIASAAVEAKLSDNNDLDAVLKMAETSGGSRELSWSLLRLTRLALHADAPAERLQTLADKIVNRAVRGQAQLLIFRAALKQTKQVVEESAADKVESDTSARWLAAQSLARHNIRSNGSYTSVVQGWPQPLKSFGSLGVALGLQDGRR